MIYVIMLIAYLIGSINSSIIISKLWKKVDIRNFGSGNAGATNTLRTLGKGPAVLVVLGDALKGIIAVILGRILGDEIGGMIAGIAVVIGHNWPVFFGFKGGKGILTSAVVILMVTPQIGWVIVATSILIIIFTRYVSLGSIVGAVMLPMIVTLVKPADMKLISFSAILAVLAIFRHRSNIKRLLHGTESKFGSEKKQEDQDEIKNSDNGGR